MRVERNREDWKFYRASIPKYLLFGVSLQNCYGWSEPIHALFDGAVVAVKDGWPERNHLHILRDLAVVLKNAAS